MKILRIILYVVLGLSLLAAGGAYGVYRWATKDLPNFTEIADYQPNVVTTVYAQDGQVMGYFYKEKRWLVRLDEMSRWLPMAFLAAEDSSFYDHEGVDLMAIFRAMIINLKAGSIKQGGSTITQQIVKQLLLTNERSYERKIKEAILAYRLENYLNKEEILTIYLNEIFLGANSYGVEAAARTYFGKHVSDLTLAECAVLAGLPQAPSRYNPYLHPTSARVRQKYVLGEMLELGWISPEEYREALDEPIEFKQMYDPSWKVGAYYLEEVRRALIEQFGEHEVYTKGYSVYTACDMKHQAAAEQAMRDGLEAAAKRHGWIGPVDHLAAALYADFLVNHAQDSATLEQGDKLKVLVTKVDAGGATVLIPAKGEDVPVNSISFPDPLEGMDREAYDNFLKGSALLLDVLLPGRIFQPLLVMAGEGRSEIPVTAYEAFIPVKSMSWARKPDPSVMAAYAPAVKDARKVLNEGDVVMASVAEIPEDRTQDWTLNLEIVPKVQGALVSLDPNDGQVKALVGGYDYMQSEFNRATQAKRQPGSAFKPIVYSVAIDNGFTAASVVMDAPIVFENTADGTLWRPENYENKFFGPTLLRTALVKSRNLVTIRVAQKIGIDKIITRAKDLGLEADFPHDLSVALGSASIAPINLCKAYSVFPRGGSTIQPRLILEVKDHMGQTLFASEPEAHEAISPQTAFIIATLMKEVVQSGTGRGALVLGRPLAGKTGTTNEERDAWFMGYAPYLLTGVFVGYDEPIPMGRGEVGGRAALPIWVGYRQAVEEDYPVQDFVQPPGVVMVQVDGKTGLRAGPGSAETFFLPFKAGTEPTKMASAPDSGGGSSESAEDDLFKQGF